MAQKKYNKKNVIIGVVGGFITLVILVVGTILSNIGARDDAENAGRSISLLYLSELAELPLTSKITKKLFRPPLI